MLHRIIDSPDAHKWPQDRLRILMSQMESKGTEGDVEQDHRCEAENTMTSAARECAQ
jgi:hypothetical protein